jgi:putative glutamine amidotransferase
MARPVIGLTSYLEDARWGQWHTRAALLHEWYVTHVTAAGARAVLLPPDDGDADVLDRLDGLIVTGGADVEPDRYGEAPLPTSGPFRPARDTAELLLYTEARARGLPVLGICRGLQIMAVAEGGTLTQHLPDVTPVVHNPGPGAFSEHEAHFAEGSLIAGILGTTDYTVNSSHHQSVADAGRLTPTGWAQDETIEVCEDPAAGFVLGVQWHPEHEADPRIFQAFAAACSS